MKERTINLLREKIYKINFQTKGLDLIKTNVAFYVKPFRKKYISQELVGIHNCGSLYEETSIDSFSEVIKRMGKKYEVTLTSKVPENLKESKKYKEFSSEELKEIKSKLEKKLKRHEFVIE